MNRVVIDIFAREALVAHAGAHPTVVRINCNVGEVGNEVTFFFEDAAYAQRLLAAINGANRKAKILRLPTATTDLPADVEPA